MGTYEKEKALHRRRIEKGLCQMCGNFPHSDNKKTCVFCSIKRSSRDGVPLYTRRKESGLCVKCGKAPPNKNKTMCEPCSEKNRAKAARFAREKRVPAVKTVYEHYGNTCVCCGASEPLFLTIDHINSDGAEHRRNFVGSARLPMWLVENDFPEGFQILCFNCNCGRQRNGGLCPHKEQHQ